jgi:hypothetical protein
MDFVSLNIYTNYGTCRVRLFSIVLALELVIVETTVLTKWILSGTFVTTMNATNSSNN